MKATGTVKRKSTPSTKAKAGRTPVPASPYKLLAIDLDGTLLNHEGQPNDVDVAAIRRLKARGIAVTILTGRLYSGTKPSADLLGIEGPVGCADGSHIVQVKYTKTLLHRGVRDGTGHRAQREGGPQ